MIHCIMIILSWFYLIDLNEFYGNFSETYNFDEEIIYTISPDELNWWYEEDMSLVEKIYYDLEEKYKIIDMGFENQNVYTQEEFSDLQWKAMVEYFEWENKYSDHSFVLEKISKRL